MRQLIKQREIVTDEWRYADEPGLLVRGDVAAVGEPVVAETTDAPALAATGKSGSETASTQSTAAVADKPVAPGLFVAGAADTPGLAVEALASAIDLSKVRALIFPLKQWLAERERWWLWDGKLGVRVGPTDDVAALEHDFLRVSLVAIEFSGLAEGRGYSQAQLLRTRYRFGGELRAMGKIQRDQLFYMARCGFDAFEFPEGTDLNAVRFAFGDFSAAYQSAADTTVHLQRRRVGANR